MSPLFRGTLDGAAIEVPPEVVSTLGAWVTAAKRGETRRKRLEGMADMLRSGRKTP